MIVQQDEIQLALGVRDLALAAERYRVRMARAILGVGGTEMIALGAVRIDGPQTPSQLARKLGITTASATELLDRLQQAGLAERRPHPSDRRKLLVTLTPTAEQAVTAIYRHLDRVLAGVADLDPAGRQGVINFLHDAASALHNAGITSDGQLQPPAHTPS